MAEVSDVIKDVGDATSAIFRHLVPGVFALAVAATIRPDVFSPVDFGSSEWLILLLLVALAIGNIWFVVHRYFIQQLIDVLFWATNCEGGPKRVTEKYHAGVASHTHKYFKKDAATKEFLKHLRFRTSSVVLLYMSAEILFVAGIAACGADFISNHRELVLVTSVIMFFAAVWQNYLTRQLESKVSA